MNTFKALLSTCLIYSCCFQILYAQEISRSVISSGGTEYSSENGLSLDATFGEIVIEDFRGPFILTQGFQQGDILEGEDVPTPEIDATIFPNPFEDELLIDIKLDADIEMRVYNVLGQLVYNTIPQTEQMSIRTSDWHTGVYFVYFSAGGKRLFVEKVIKHESE